jgi:hypothetical protein
MVYCFKRLAGSHRARGVYLVSGGQEVYPGEKPGKRPFQAKKRRVRQHRDLRQAVYPQTVSRRINRRPAHKTADKSAPSLRVGLQVCCWAP